MGRHATKANGQLTSVDLRLFSACRLEASLRQGCQHGIRAQRANVQLDGLAAAGIGALAKLLVQARRRFSNLVSGADNPVQLSQTDSNTTTLCRVPGQSAPVTDGRQVLGVAVDGAVVCPIG